MTSARNAGLVYNTRETYFTKSVSINGGISDGQLIKQNPDQLT